MTSRLSFRNTRMKHRLVAGCLAVMMLLLSGCTYTSIVNSTGKRVGVFVVAPGYAGAQYTIMDTAGTVEFNSRVGGTYIVRILPDVEKIEELENDIKIAEISKFMATTDQEREEAFQEAIRARDAKEKYLESTSAASCSGTAFDYSMVAATLAFENGTYIVSCEVSEFADIIELLESNGIPIEVAP